MSKTYKGLERSVIKYNQKARDNRRAFWDTLNLIQCAENAERVTFDLRSGTATVYPINNFSAQK